MTSTDQLREDLANRVRPFVLGCNVTLDQCTQVTAGIVNTVMAVLAAAAPKPCGARSRWFDAVCTLDEHPTNVNHEGRTPSGSLVTFNTVHGGGESVG